MAIPVAYIARNLLARKLTTLLTAGGMALVVYVFATVLMLAAGLEKTLVSTGQDDNVVVIRRSSQTEVQSGIDRNQARIVETLPEIMVGPAGERLISKEPVVLISLPKRSTGKPANVVIRGVTPAGIELRPQVHIVEGRLFRPGTAEIVVGRAIANGFKGTGIGQTLRFASRDWTIVGVFDAGHTGFDSEIWGDAEQMLQAFRRLGFSSLLFKLVDPDRFDEVKKTLESDPRLTLEAKRESRFYAEQSRALANFISYLGTGISVIFSIGAIIGAMITMYASVATRVSEIGTLRALGFSRVSILSAFLGEALLLGLVGGTLGLIGASAMQALEFSTTNFQTFAEIAFSFTLTPRIV
ncbi:MAG TPA: ABC transporter permease, partial [Casimicrobiaceae bacterium]|nr:ABC transporter permease [Casimicrobiaceae bacterium]